LRKLLILLSRTAIQGLYGGWAVGINYFILIALGGNTAIQREIKNRRICSVFRMKKGLPFWELVRARLGFGGFGVIFMAISIVRVLAVIICNSGRRKLGFWGNWGGGQVTLVDEDYKELRMRRAAFAKTRSSR
jgi:hypothetical protein